MNKSLKYLVLEAILLVIIMSLSESLFIAVISIILHEFSHILVGRHYGCKLYKLNISLTGANAKLSDVSDLKDFQKLNLYAVGPGVNLFIFIFLFCLNRALINDYIMLIGEINLGLFVFNMIPVYPLDGSKILEIILTKWGTYRQAKKIIGNLSYVFSVFLGSIFIFDLIAGKINISLVLISVLVAYSTYTEKKSTIYIMMQDLFRKGNLIEKYEYIENRSISVSYKNSLLNLLRMIDKNKFNIFYILDEELKYLGQIREDELIDGLKKFGNISIEEYLIEKKRDTINGSYL